ncbi:uncharacterized protein LOC113760073 [Coffea eugenioides]|uniref:uncharacterized protein LOC113760073 n=1 Tax=Coffea eugenioides TaxID=49369 RepID=UPI000F60DF3D|nr:uncharacterized protein LOC113760073 [Coffea eugenioides]
MGEKVVSFTGIKGFVTVAWGYPKNLGVVELGPNLFQFNLPNPGDREKILERGPWVIDNQMLVVNRWMEGIEGNMEAFKLAPMWVQVWNLPIHWITKEIGRKIGAVFHQVKDVIIPQMGGKEGRHLKMFVTVDLSKPLLRRTIVKTEEILTWVAFKYERCPDFCYNCGFVGHGERTCTSQLEVLGRNVDNQYGPWLRAGNTKSSPQTKQSRHEVDKDKRYWKFLNGNLVEIAQPSSVLEKNQLELNKVLERERQDRQNLSKDLNDLSVDGEVSGLFQEEVHTGGSLRQQEVQEQAERGKDEQKGALVVGAAKTPLVESCAEMEEDSSLAIPVVSNVGNLEGALEGEMLLQEMFNKNGKVQEAIRKQ